MADDVSVKIGADDSGSTKVYSDAAGALSSMVDKMAGKLDHLSEVSRRNAEEVKKHNKDVEASFESMGKKIEHVHSGIEHVLEKFKGGIAALGAALAGGFLGKEAVESMLEFEGAVRGLEIQFGMTAERAVELNTQLTLAGISAEKFEGMAMKVNRVLKSQSGEYERLNVVYKDAAGNLLPMDEIMKNIYKRMQDFKSGTDQQAFALATAGRGAREFASDMERFTRVEERAIEVQHALGIEMGPDRQAQIEEYRVQLNVFKLMVEEAGVKIGEVLLPGLLRLGQWFGEIGPNAVTVIVTAVKVLVTVFTALAAGIRTIWEVFSTTIQVMYHFSEGIAGVGFALANFGKTGFGGLAAAAKSAWTKMADDAKQGANNIVDTWEEAGKRMATMWEDLPDGKKRASVLPGSGDERYKLKPKGKDDKDTRLAEWKDALIKEQEAEGYFREYSKSQEIKFWEEKLALVTGYNEKDLELRRHLNQTLFSLRKADAREQQSLLVETLHDQISAAKFNKQEQLRIAHDISDEQRRTWGEDSKQYKHALKAELAIRQEFDAELRKMDELLAINKARVALSNVATAKAEFDLEVALGRVSNDKKIAQHIAFSDQAYQIERARLQREADALRVNENATLETKLAALEKIEDLTRKHEAEILKIKHDAVLEAAKYELAAIATVQNSTTTLIEGLMNHTKSLKDVMKDFVRSITQGLNKLVAENLMKQLMGPGTGIQDILSKVFGGLFGTTDAAKPGVDAADASLSILSGVTDTLTEAMVQLTLATEAQQAASAAGGGGSGGGGGGGILGSLFSSAVGSGATGTAAGGAMDFVPMAVGTNYVPKDMLAIVHKGEAVVPERFNKRGMMGGVSTTINFALNGPMDTGTQDQTAAKLAMVVARAAQQNG